ncbi:Zinc finger BED domain-containing protein 5 [Holothuria leucospilota]|uniref:Zinc finger BED domain-containing protein 5 n=1 Tax=Holothuria leucospilota TaxID=206669 RepID=A0A9Q1CLM8_HOLLE|nr:Zinc finger BED domain-containing protein 5 [Holothuria leucospilota]
MSDLAPDLPLSMAREKVEPKKLKTTAKGETSPKPKPVKPKRKEDADKKWYVQRFNKKWLAHPVFKRWLVEVENEGGPSSAKCKVCNCFFRNPNKSALNKHVSTVKHKDRLYGIKRRSKTSLSKSDGTMSLQQSTENEVESRPMEDQVAIAELKLAGYVAEHRLPFSQAEHLSLLLPSLCPDSEIPKNMELMHNVKASYIIQQGIAYQEKEELAEILKNQKFSIMVDDCTDQSVPQILAVVVRYFDENNSESVDRLLGIIEVEEATPAGVFNSIKNLVDQYEIPMGNIIGLATDNNSSTLGSKSEFQTLMKQEIPKLFVMGCIWHSIPLCASYASRCLPSWVENLLCDIETYLTQSSKRTCELQMIMEAFNNPNHTVLKLSTARWSSWGTVISRVLEYYEALKLFFETEQTEDSQNDKDEKEKAMEIYKTLTTAGTEHMLLFLNYVLEKVDNMNKQFQAQGELIYHVHSTMKNSYIDILRLFIREAVIMDPKCNIEEIDLGDHSTGVRKPLKDVIVGGKCTQKLVSESLGDSESHFRQDACNFLVQLSLQLGSRFEMSDTSTLALTCCVNPAVAVDFTDQRPVSLMPLAMKLPDILDGKNPDSLDDQWLRLPFIKDSLEEAMYPVPFNECPPGTFWTTVKNIKDSEGESIFLDLGQFMCDILTLPLTSAAVERVFAEVNSIKTTATNRFHATTLENRLLAMQHVKKNGGCHLWQPHHALVTAVMDGICYQRYETFLRQNKEAVTPSMLYDPYE